MTDHVARVFSFVEDAASCDEDEIVSASWRRSAESYRIDPASNKAPRILTQNEVVELRAPLDQLTAEARTDLDQLYRVVRDSRYVVLLCDSHGTAIDHRGSQSDAEQFKLWGTWLGGVWSEEAEGTNGIGTCIVEKCPVSVHRNQHFRARHTSLSCSGAPIFDHEGELAAILDVSSIDPQLSEQSHALTGALTQAAARRIEERRFRGEFRRNWILALAPSDGRDAPMLLAVDEDQRILGADRQARLLLSLGNKQLQAGLSIWSVFEPTLSLFNYRDRGDVSGKLIRADAPETWAVLVTPPDSGAALWRNSEMSEYHRRPRLDLVSDAVYRTPAEPARGGLPPGTLRRVKEFIDAHLDQSIRIQTLADVAGLSTFHFARAFKQAAGATPHSYLLAKRLDRAEDLLTSTDLPHSKIAAATGFLDQSHFARIFKQRRGMSPGAFRRTSR